MISFDKEFIECLEKKSVDELIKFMKAYTKKGYYDRYTLNRFMMAKEEIKLGTLCKLIMNTDTSKKTKKWAMEQLEKINMGADIVL